MGPALLLIGQLYRVEEQARPMTADERLRLRQLQSRPILDKLHNYLLEIQTEVLPKSPEGRAVRYTLKNWTALTRYCEDGDLAIDNNATERAMLLADRELLEPQDFTTLTRSISATQFKLPPEGLNLESVLRHKALVLTSAAAKALEGALS